ncbi:MAG: sigma-70 family RNA polymerase sigma factor [Planctomycetes bacterium]|nr:sigma-70 family RNA polymerase sigma factor [Planctomycetota bacterium]
MDSVSRQPPVDRSPAFATTHWSLVIAAGRRSTPEAENALEQLCRTYWYPLYAFIRRRGHPSETAQDLTQGFFVKLLEKDSLAAANRNRGKFRTFLLAALKNFLSHESEKERAAKRGGDRILLSLYREEGEARYLAEPVEAMTPEKLYEKRWATTVIEQALQTLRTEYQQAGNRPLFDRLKDHLWGDRSASYADIAQEFDMNEGSVKAAAFRLRRRFAQALRDVISNTVHSPEAVEEELKTLVEAFG